MQRDKRNNIGKEELIGTEKGIDLPLLPFFIMPVRSYFH